jgi:hypothetical protein
VKLVVGLITAAALAAPAFGSLRMRYQTESKFGSCRWSRLENQVFLSLYRVSWSAGIFLLMGCCLVGWCSWITKLLSARAWTSFSRLTYGAFLVHPVLIEIRAFGGDSFIDFSSLSYTLDAAGFIFLSFALSCVLFLLVEGQFKFALSSRFCLDFVLTLPFACALALAFVLALALVLAVAVAFSFLVFCLPCSFLSFSLSYPFFFFPWHGYSGEGRVVPRFASRSPPSRLGG